MTEPHETVVVAVDGPAGSGKSSVSKAAARRLGYAYLDTGAAYRAFAWHGLNADIDLEDPAAVVGALDEFDYRITTDPAEEIAVSVAAHDVTEAIRTPRVSGVVSLVARVPEVREAVTALFRSIIVDTEKPGIVVEGRDITTVVAPDATARILLTADEDVRMKRRSAEISDVDAATTSAALRSRDRADAKVVDFMTAAQGVTTVDSTSLDFESTVDAVVDVVDKARAHTAP